MPIYGGNSTTIYRVATHDVAAFQVMYDIDGYYAGIADHNDMTHEASVLAVVQSGVSAGGVVALSRQGLFMDGTMSIPIGRLYLGAAGVITNVPPTTGVLVQVGFAAGHGEAVIDVQPAIIL